MDFTGAIKDSQHNGGYTVADSYKPVDEGSSLYDKDSLLKLAKKRVYEKRKLKRHLIIYFLAGFFGLIAASNGDLDGSFYFGCMITWTVFLIQHILAYFSPYTKNGGILKFFMRSYRDPVEAEYKKLKRMEPERIATEFKRL